MGVLLMTATLVGCSDADAQKISNVSKRTLQRAEEFTTTTREKFKKSLRPPDRSSTSLDAALRVQHRLRWDSSLQGTDIRVNLSGENLVLSGAVQETQRQRAIEIAESTVGVGKVVDTMQLAAKQ
jgi:hypothetical protein